MSQLISQRDGLFVSYASANAAQVHPLANWLEEQGIRVWIDVSRIEAGAYFGTEIVRGIDQSSYFLLCCSPESFRSEVVFYEIDYSLRSGLSERLPLWLAEPPNGPASQWYPERIRLFFPMQCLFAKRMEHSQLCDYLLRVVQKRCQLHSPVSQNVNPKDYAAAIQASNWPEVVRLGTLLLRVNPGNPSLIQGIANARGWVEHERMQLLRRLQTQPTVRDWELVLERYPNLGLSDHARFRLALTLPLAQLSGYLARCLAGNDSTWRIAEAIVRLRFKDATTALQRLNQVRVEEPGNAAAVYFLGVATLAAIGQRGWMHERIVPVNDLIRLAEQLKAPGCYYPLLLQKLMNDDYYIPSRQRSPFNIDNGLDHRAARSGIRPDEYQEIRNLYL